MEEIDNYIIGIIGLGYVGLPLAVSLQNVHFKVIGYDINDLKIRNIKLNVDNDVVDKKNLATAIKNGLVLTNDEKILGECNVYIVAVPTPVDTFYTPDLRFLKRASKIIGNVLGKGDIVIYESTVYPGCTEEICLPILEEMSQLKNSRDFGLGYSPERINPGDITHRLDNVVKIISANDTNTLAKMENIYKRIVDAGVYKASSIKVAEAAKVVENTQRDVNISFVNELALIFDRMGLDTNEVIDAASTKWNFLPFRPGLVGGHCISVDPYYLTYKAQQLGYNPEVILSGRRINNEMPQFIVNKVVKLMAQRNCSIQKSDILILGFAFKENCKDFRNTRVADMYNEFKEFGAKVTVVDPHVDKRAVYDNFKIDIKENLTGMKYDAVILAVAHTEFKKWNISELKKENTSVVFDTKDFFPRELVSARL